jgi:riboflavin transporter FmnP
LLRRYSKAYFIVSTAIMAALSIIFELIPSFRVFWGMKIDLVGVMWVLAYFLYGLNEALCVSVITTIFILLYSPTGFVGATMKFVATVPMFLVPAGLLHLPIFTQRTSKALNRVLTILVAGTLAILVRIAVTSLVNYYWAVPLFLGIPSSVLLERFFGGSVLAFVIYVTGMNLLQGIVDVVVPWFLAFKVRLAEYFGTW